jgi:tetratricopeptide (TPR) repeat protein
MSEGPLQLSIKWLRLFAEGRELLDAGDHDGALAVLESALAVIEAVDAMSKDENPDNRVAETLERIAFVYQQKGLLTKAEPLYRRAMEIAHTHILGVHLRMAIHQNLAKLLTDTGREEEGKVLLGRYPLAAGVGVVSENPLTGGDGIEAAVDAFAEAAVAYAEASIPTAIEQPSLEGSMMMSLNTLAFMNQESTQMVLSLMKEFVEHAELCYGTLSNEFSEAAERIARGYTHALDVSTALSFLQKAFLAKLSIVGDDKEIASLGMDLAMCDKESALSKALVAKYHRAEQFDDPLTLANSIMSKIAAAQGEVAEPLPIAVAAKTVDVEEAEKIIEEWRQAQAFTIKAPSHMTRDEQCRHLLPLAEKAVALAQEVEANDAHPLSTICLLSDKSKVHKELGDNAQALKCKEMELAVIASHWGEGHQLMVEAHMQYTKLQQEM